MDKDNIIFSTIPAKKINKYAAEKIAHYIIITCNYNPNTNFISSDAIYISAIQNLYKFLIDSGIANKLTDLWQIMPIAKRFSYNKRLIGMLRTKICHNKNKSNDIEMIEEQYANWVRSVINKNVPSSLADYDKLKEMLMEIGQELVEDIINFIDDSLNHNKKEEIKEGIEKLWINYYKSLSGEEIIRKQLWDYYLTSERNVYSRFTWYEKKQKLNSFCERYYCGEILNKIKKNQNLIGEYGLKLDKNVLYKLQEELEQFENELEMKKKDAEKMGGFFSQYINEIQKKIEQEIELIRNNPNRTLLPEDLLISIIDKDFNNI